MTNIPAFRKEDYMKSPRDCMDNVEFYLSQYNNGESINNVSQTWASKTKNLMESEYFGNAVDVEYATFLFNQAQRLTEHDKNIEESLRHIFNYVRDNFVSYDDNDLYVHNSLIDVNKNHKGTSNEINLFLVALYRQAKIAADPVILATTDMGYNPPQFPITNKLNKVICRTWLYGEPLYLDASVPRGGFGKLPLECYNGFGRIISYKDSGFVYFYPDSIREQNMTSVFISNGDKGQVNGTFENIPGYYGSYDVRDQVHEMGTKKYFEDIRTGYGTSITIINPGIDSLNQYDAPVRVHYDFSLPKEGEPGIIYFLPVMQDARVKNALKAEDRRYPVEMPYPIDDLYVLNMEIPDGYQIDEIPKSAKVTFNGEDGMYEYLISADETNIQLRSHIKMKRSGFLPDEYNTLRDFFAFIEKKQNEQIVFKKKGKK
jgi:hypothetical protein